MYFEYLINYETYLISCSTHKYVMYIKVLNISQLFGNKNPNMKFNLAAYYNSDICWIGGFPIYIFRTFFF